MERDAAAKQHIGPIKRAIRTAKRALGKAQDKSAELGSSAHEKATDLQAGLTAQLEAGAQALRHPASGVDARTTGVQSSESDTTQGLLPRARARAASGLEDAADYLYRHDVTDWIGALERRTQARPMRALLVALGAGLAVGILSRRPLTRRRRATQRTQ